MELCTRLRLSSPPFTLSYSDKLLLVGSCFADNIGTKLAEYKFSVDVNPFGTLYNPFSIASAARRLGAGTPYTENELFLYEGRYHSFDHHSRFSAASAGECLERINDRLAASHRRLAATGAAVVTLGTAWAYRLKETGRTVANCHKVPENRFDRRRYGPEELAAACHELVGTLWKANPGMHIVFTVSPIRHWKDGAHANQLSKAALLLAADRICSRYPEKTDYFPAYEIMMDELRDYRFYADDMLHPSPLAVNYIWQRFRDHYFAPETRRVMEAWEAVQKAVSHRPFDTQSEAYQKFIVQTLLKIERITEKFPSFDAENEIQFLKSKLNGNYGIFH